MDRRTGGQEPGLLVSGLPSPTPGSASCLHLPGKAPSPSQLSVTELPGDSVRLTWAASAPSGVLVYQIKWTPLGEGKAHEVRIRVGKGMVEPQGRPAKPRPLAGPGVRPRLCPPRPVS